MNNQTPAGAGLVTGRVFANGLHFSYLEMGQGPLVLALHGFPDTPRTFCYQLPALAAAGYRVVAPYTRGYFPTDLPPDGRYESAALAQDVVALMAVLSQEPVILLGHDWGASAAYGAAVLAPERVAGLITIAVPPSANFRRAFVTNPAQQRRSWYMYFFQMAYAEMAVEYNDFAFVERLWQDWSPGWAYSAEDIEALKTSLRQPGVL